MVEASYSTMPKRKKCDLPRTAECYWCKNTRYQRDMVKAMLHSEKRWVCNWKMINDCNSPHPAVQSYQ